MTPIWKEVLCLGRQRDPRTKLWYTITPKRIKDAHRNFKKMQSRGVPVPAVWEHQNIEAGDAPVGADAIAEWKRNYARYTFCHPNDSRINDRGNLELLHPVESDEDAKQLLKTKFISPKIYNGYSDSGGGEYEGTTIAHCAATPSPVQWNQRPFSLELSETDVLYLSYAPVEDEEESPEDANCPVYSEAFNEWLDALELSMTAAPDEESTVADETESKPEEKSGEGEGGMNEELKAVVKALRENFGAKISDKVSNWGELVIALESNSGSEVGVGTDMAPEPEPDVTANADEATTGATGAPPMVMSTLDKDPKRRARAEKFAVEERTEATKRVNTAFETGRIDGPKKRALLRVATGGTGIAMSFTATGEAGGKDWSAFLANLAEVEKKPVNSAWKPTGRRNPDGTVEMSTTDVPLPKVPGTETTPERAQLGADVILGKISVADAAKK